MRSSLLSGPLPEQSGLYMQYALYDVPAKVSDRVANSRLYFSKADGGTCGACCTEPTLPSITWPKVQVYAV